MIFVTVGSQLPFDRLIQTVDHWHAENKSITVFAQIGISNYAPQHIDFCQTMTPDIYHDYLQKANLVIAHAGMGTIISALEFGKTLILMPRLASQGEHRNDHQLATAKRFSDYFTNIIFAYNEKELVDILKNLPEKVMYDKLEILTDSNLLNKIQLFIKESF